MRLILAALMAFTALPTPAATIYLCKAYNGSMFWAPKSCSQYSALTDRIESVADVPWAQQVQQAEARRGGSAPTPDYNRENLCDQLYAEKRHIERRYEAGGWQDVPTVNRDQARTRALQSQLAANRCRMQ